MRNSLQIPRNALRRLFHQRCFYLFALLLALVIVSPFIDGRRGVYLLNGLNAFIILSTAAAVGRTALSFLVVFCLLAGAVSLRLWEFQHLVLPEFDWGMLLHATVYIAVIALMLRYVFGPEVMDADRLWGAASVYLMIGILWCFLYSIIDFGSHDSFRLGGAPTKLELGDVLYFSFSTLATIGFGDIAPATRGARVASILEGIIGQLFIAILIAKLVGVYPPGSAQTPPRPST